MNLFCYGTLMFPVVLERFIAHGYTLQPAILPDYARYAMKNQLYPGVRHEKGSETPGYLLQPLGKQHLRRLDAYEGTRYLRRKLAVRLADGSEVNSWCYIIPKRHQHLLSSQTWDPDVFVAKNLTRYLRALQHNAWSAARVGLQPF